MIEVEKKKNSSGLDGEVSAKLTKFLITATAVINFVLMIQKVSAGFHQGVWFNIVFILISLILLVVVHFFRRVLIGAITFLVISNLLILIGFRTAPSPIAPPIFFIILIYGTHVLLGFENLLTALSLSVLSTVFSTWGLFVSYNDPGIVKNYLLIAFICADLVAIGFPLYQNHQINKSNKKLIEQNDRMRKDSEELKKINSELDKFVYSVSHDVRAPLTSILGLVNVSKFSKSQSECVDIMGMIEKSATTLLKFCGDILDYSKNYNLPVGLQIVNLKKLIHEIQIDFSLRNPELQGVMVMTNFDDDFSVHCDSHRLKIILGNLYSNSLKFTNKNAPKSFINIEARIVDELVTIIFADNGIGILPERLPFVFNMFYKGTVESHGSGLGLYLVKDTVEKMGGVVGISSEYGAGTVVRIVMPSPKLKSPGGLSAVAAF